jgi:predicted PurR-regulated permease PerM
MDFVLKVPIMVDKSASRLAIGNLVEVVLPLLLLGLLIALCIQLLVPFVGLLLWTLILAVCFYPVHKALTKRGTSNRVSASIIGTGLVAIILVPTAIAAISAASSIPAFVEGLKSGRQHIPPPPDRLLDVPIVGAKVHAAWTQAANDMPGFAQKFAPQLASFSKWMLGQAGGMIGVILGLVLAVIFAAITIAYADATRAFMASILARITGSSERGEHYMEVIAATIRSVANGVIGVAFVQALLCGIGFFVIGVPGAGLLALAAMLLGVVQVPVVLVTLPAIIWAFSVKSTTVAIIFLVWEIIGGLSDAALKPLMIGHGLEVPMPVILLGVIGGVIAYGLVGLFIGAVLLAVGWVLMIEWLDLPSEDKPAQAQPRQVKGKVLSAAE